MKSSTPTTSPSAARARKSSAIAAAALATLLALIASSAAAHADAARDFGGDAALFYRVVACGGDRAVEPALAQAVAAHCRALEKPLARFRKRYLDKAAPFLAALRPADLPRTVVYPFGGGDLVSALLTYPDATEITTISLEHAGDPRRLRELDARELAASLALFREAASGLFKHNDHASVNLRKLERGPVPGQLAFTVLALALHGFEPVSLRFFRLEPDGSIHYLSAREITERDGVLARKKSHSWVDTDYSVAFTNAEIGFRERGNPRAPVRIHRHIAANLANGKFANSPLQAHLASKRQNGKIVAMTKAASYLLWNPGFSKIRKYLLDNMVFMVSDSTGIPPRFARRARFDQITYGGFETPFLDGAADSPFVEEFAELWRSQRRRRLPFRYGYPDGGGRYHMMVTRPRKKARSRRTGGRSKT